MSLYGALYAGVAGLSAQSNKLGIISDNIANVNTVGYKQTSASFEALVTSSGGSAAYTPGGVLGNSQQLISTQGLLQSTTSGTDIAVSGQGFFIVNQKADQSGQVLYTRAGSFTQDAQGNFTNSAGFFLQAWPLDRNGNLPGAPGNTNTQSSANLSSLQTVNVENLAGTAAATTLISVGANLDSSQAVLTGAGAKATPDPLDTLNEPSGSPLTGSGIIVPNATDKIVKGDTLNISTGTNASGFNYTYGGFTYGRDVTSALASGDGENAVNLATDSQTLTPPVVTLNTTALSLAANKMTDGASVAGATPIIVNASTTGMKTGDYVTISGVTAGLDGITPIQINGQRQITVIDATHFSFVSNGTGTTLGGGVAGTNAGSTVTPTPLYVNPSVTGHTLVTISQVPPANIAVGDWVTLAGVTSPVDGITMNGTFQVKSLDDANHFTVDSLQTPTTPAVVTLNTTAQGPLAAGAMVTGASVSGATPITVTGVDATNLHVGDYVTISGEATGIDGITPSQINGQRQITAVTGTSFTFASTGTGTTPGGNVTGGTGDTVTPNPFYIHASAAGHTLVTISQVLPANIQVGSYVTLSAGSVDGINLTGSFQVTSLDDADHFTIDSLGTPSTPPVVTLSTTAVGPLPAGAMSDTAGPNSNVTVATASAGAAGFKVGDWVNITGSAGFDGIAAGSINGSHQIASITAGVSITFATTANGGGSLTSAGGETVTAAPLSVGSVATPGATLVTISQPVPANLKVGQYVTLAAGTVDGINLNGSFQVTSIASDGLHYTVNSLGTGTTTNTAGGTGVVTAQVTVGGNQAGGSGIITTHLTTGGSVAGGAGTITSEHAPITTTAGSPIVNIYEPAHGLVSGDVVTLSNIPAGGIGGLTQAQLTGSFIVTLVDANHYTITAAANAVTSSADGVGTVATGRPYVGNIFDATNASQPFFGVTGITGIDPNALSFNIQTAATGIVKFSYKAISPNAAQGEFNSLDTLADAINATVGLTARVGSDNRLYVGATDATQAVNFTNNQISATTGPNGPLAGVNWVDELGLQSFSQASSRFNSLSSLGALINNSTGLTSSVENPLGAADLKINVIDPTDTITFKDGALNTGSLLGQLGLGKSLNGGAFVAETAGPTGPAYDAQVATTNMASGAISPQFSRPVSVFDGLGTSHNLNIAFVKLQNNTWGVEVYAQPATDITPSSSSLVDGQVATGTIRFNGDGSLQSVSPSLTNLINVNWTNGSTPSALSINWGTQGLPFGTVGAASIGKTDGLSQFDSGYNVSFVNQNGSPVGQLTGISIDDNGYITASYNNGETQKLYKIPLASFTDPNLLLGTSGNAYSQTNDSGIANLKEAGSSGVGTISPGSLESSNVELASQLTDMIVAQRAYEANTKVIQTADSLLQALDQIIQ